MKEVNKNKEQSKDIYDIARQIEIQKNKNVSNEQQAKRILKAYTKVEQINPNYEISKKTQTKIIIQPTSTYANKIKQTLKELNANKTKQYQKIVKPTSKKSIQNIQGKNQHEERLKKKAIKKINDILQVLINRKFKKSFDRISKYYEQQIENDFKMGRKYRLFRLFNLWKEEIAYLKLENQKIRKQEGLKEEEGNNLAKQFRRFVICRKVFRSWYENVKREQKKRKYQREMKELEKIQKKQQETRLNQKQKTKQNPLQNKLKGFLDGLKDKIQTKDKDRLKTIKQKTEESIGAVIPQTEREHQNQLQNQNNQSQNYDQQINHLSSSRNRLVRNSQNQQNIKQEELSNQEQLIQGQQAQQNHSKKPLTNQQLQQKRKQLEERSKNRKKMLQKLKKQKQDKKNKEELERQQLQKVIEQEQKKIKQQQYRQYLKNKQIQQQWQQKQRILNQRAQQFNRLRILKFYGFNLWRNLKIKQIHNTIQIKDKIQKVLRDNLSKFVLQNLLQNLQQKLQIDYENMRTKYQRKLKKKTLIGFKNEKTLQLQKKQEYHIFHEVHMIKIFFVGWLSIMEDLRLENFEWQRPRVKKSNEFHKVLLMIKAIKAIKQNKIQCKKNKNIEEHKTKIKKKIDSIMSQKIQINYDDFL